jgi:phage internal scaffolding protein
MKLKQPYAYCSDEHSLSHATHNHEPSLTEGSHSHECDINNIVKRYAAGHIVPTVTNPPEYGDFTQTDDFRTALHQVRQAQAHFDALPAELRREFDNDPGNLLGFLADPANRQRAVELGLVHQPEPQLLVPASALATGEAS